MTINKSTLSIALGSVFVASMAASSVAGAAQSPFAMASLDKGYMVAEADKAKEGKCGGNKANEAKCGANKAKEAKCGANKAKMKDGKCGEGKCGATKK
jgi:uncharacterized low-complexity protein